MAFEYLIVFGPDLVWIRTLCNSSRWDGYLKNPNTFDSIGPIGGKIECTWCPSFWPRPAKAFINQFFVGIDHTKNKMEVFFIIKLTLFWFIISLAKGYYEFILDR